MLADLQNIMSDKQSLIAAVGTVVSTNIIDLRAVGTIPQGGSPIADIGRGKRLSIMVQLTTTYLASGGASTVDFQVCNSANSDGSSPTIIDSSGAIAKATLVAGYIVPVGRNLWPMTARYLCMNYVIATNNGTAGNVWAGIESVRQSTPYVTQ
jgi:hypothetical protein